VTYEQPPGAEPAKWRPSSREVGAFIVVLVVLVFAVANFQDVKIDLVFGSVTMPLFFVITVPALLGFGVGMLVQRRRGRRRR